MTIPSAPSTLTPDELKRFSRELKKSKTLQGNYTVSQWLERLRHLAKRDSKNDHLRKWLIAGMILFPFCGMFALAGELFLLAHVFGLTFIVSVILFFVLKSHDIPNRLRDSLVPLLTILQQDTDAQAPMTLQVDLNGPESKRKQTDTHTTGKGYPKIVETWFMDPWFEGSAILQDGSVLHWQITDRVRRRKITRRNSRRKIKTKTKFKIKSRMDISLSVKKSRYMLATTNTTCKKESEKKWLLSQRCTALSEAPGGQMALPEFLHGVSTLFNQLKPAE